MEEMQEAEAKVLNKNMKPYLDIAHAGMKLHEPRTRENVRILESVLKEMCEALKLMGQLFSELYNRFVYTGTYYENTRIKSADEFDINVVLPRKSFPPIQVKYGESGPARILHIYTRSGRIDVDLVPVFQTPNNEWSMAMDTDPRVLKFMRSKGINIDEAECCLVPKEQHPHNDPLYWRVHFPYVERGLMSDNGCLKPTIRLLKLLRDSQGWHGISSYALKTLVILRTMEEPEGYWTKKNHGITFYQTLEQLQRVLLNGGIPYLYSSSVDLLHRVGIDTRTSWAGSLNNVLGKIREDPRSILDYIGLSDGTCTVQRSLNTVPVAAQQDEQQEEQQPSVEEQEEASCLSRLCGCTIL